MGELALSSDFVSILHSVNKQPLAMWEKKIRTGRVKRVRDEDLCSQALELIGPKPASTYISCPADPKQTLGVSLPVLNMTVKNLHKMFAFDVQILDSKNVKRRFRASTYQPSAEVKPFTCRLPLSLEDGWNQITFPLQEFTYRCYGTNYVQTLRLQVYASCRLRRVFFSNKVYTEQELPLEFKLSHLTMPKKIEQRKITNCGLISILNADNDAPLKLWDKKLRDGKLKRVTESDMKGLVLDFTGKVPFTNYICCPSNSKTHLGIRYPYMVLTVKTDEAKFFAIDVQILDDTGTRRRFRLATTQAAFDVQPFYCRIPLTLEEGWNNVVVPLHHLTREVYSTRYIETLRLQIYPTCRIKKLYFADRDYDEEDLPKEFQHYSVFTEHLIKKKYEDAARKAVAVGSKFRGITPQVSRLKKVSSEFNCKKLTRSGKFTIRDVIPRVIPVNCGLKQPARATYSNM